MVWFISNKISSIQEQDALIPKVEKRQNENTQNDNEWKWII